MGSKEEKAKEYFTSLGELEDLEFLGMPLIVCIADLSRNEYPPNGDSTHSYDMVKRVEGLCSEYYPKLKEGKLEKKLLKMADKDYKITSNYETLQSLIKTSIDRVVYNRKAIQFEDEEEQEIHFNTKPVPKSLPPAPKRNDFSDHPPMAPR